MSVRFQEGSWSIVSMGAMPLVKHQCTKWHLHTKTTSIDGLTDEDYFEVYRGGNALTRPCAFCKETAPDSIQTLYRLLSLDSLTDQPFAASRIVHGSIK